jgi:hypothetical protein
MPGLLNLWYEQMPYHKILPLEYNLSMKISFPPKGFSRFCAQAAKFVAARSDLTNSLDRPTQVSPSPCAIISENDHNPCQIAKSSAQN